jgi:hypothetical protein
LPTVTGVPPTTNPNAAAVGDPCSVVVGMKEFVAVTRKPVFRPNAAGAFTAGPDSSARYEYSVPSFLRVATQLVAGFPAD